MQLNWKVVTSESLKENISSCNLVSQIPLQGNGTVFFFHLQQILEFFWVLKFWLLYKLKLCKGTQNWIEHNNFSVAFLMYSLDFSEWLKDIFRRSNNTDFKKTEELVSVVPVIDCIHGELFADEENLINYLSLQTRSQKWYLEIWPYTANSCRT